jgi:hypothetical protein
MKQPILNPAMYARIAYNSMKQKVVSYWEQHLWFRYATLIIVLMGALLTAFACKKPNYNHVT